MTEQTKSNIQEAAGCLGSIPNRAGPNVLANQAMLEQIAAGGTVVVFDKCNSSEITATDIHSLEIEQAQRVMRVGRKRNDGQAIPPKAEPYYSKFDKRR